MCFHVLTIPYSYLPIWFLWKKRLKGLFFVARCVTASQDMLVSDPAGRLDWYWLRRATRQGRNQAPESEGFSNCFKITCILRILFVLKATTMAQKLENITLTARETNMAALFALRMHPGSM